MLLYLAVLDWQTSHGLYRSGVPWMFAAFFAWGLYADTAFIFECKFREHIQLLLYVCVVDYFVRNTRPRDCIASSHVYDAPSPSGY